MSIEIKEKVIEGKRVQVVQFDALKGWLYHLKLVKLLGPGIFRFLKSPLAFDGVDLKEVFASIKDTQGMLPEDKAESFTAVLSQVVPGISDILLGVVSDLSPEDVTRFTNELCTGVSIESNGVLRPVSSSSEFFDSCFAGQYLFMYKVLLFVIEANFGNFFKMGATGQGNQGQTTPVPPKSEK